jgi:hypothetical protein
MKILALALIMNIGSIAAIICATVAAVHGVPGWGWFLFVAILLTNGTTQKNKQETGR